MKAVASRWGAAFDLDGIELTSNEQAEWEATLERFKDDFSDQVRTMLKPAADELGKRREALKKLQEEFRTRTKKRRLDTEADGPSQEAAPGRGRSPGGSAGDGEPGAGPAAGERPAATAARQGSASRPAAAKGEESHKG